MTLRGAVRLCCNCCASGWLGGDVRVRRPAAPELVTTDHASQTGRRRGLAEVPETATLLHGSYRPTGVLSYRLLFRPTPSRAGATRWSSLLHGSGAVGTDNTRQLGQWPMSGPRRRTQAFPGLHPGAQFAEPQRQLRPSPPTACWPPARPSPAPRCCRGENLMPQYAIDADRVYVTGSRCLRPLRRCANPAMFAAAVAFSGIPPEAQRRRTD